MASPSFDPRKWRVKGNGKGLPVSVFDIPDSEAEMANKDKTNINPWVMNGIAVVVTMVWAVSFLADILVKDYAPPVGIHVVFTTIVGAIFGFQLVKGKDN